jgi:hypothetical protein
MGTNWFARIINRIRGRDALGEYYHWLLHYGRITEGQIIDMQNDDSAVTIFYRYYISNVQYESSQVLTPQQLSRDGTYLPGATVTVRFDPRYPGRSVVQ